MKNWEKCKIQRAQSIMEALAIIDDSALQIALVVDEQDRLLGTVTDGDIRRAILKHKPLQACVAEIMNVNPKVVADKDDRQVVLAKMRAARLQHLPLVNASGTLVGLVSLSDLAYMEPVENPVVLMVGGLGARLRPLTEECPKPLLRVGNKPILETILDNFIECGFYNFYFAVNYKAEMIEDYFGDGARFGVKISYLRETKRMGTAGALSLLPVDIRKEIIVMNGDLLTKVNFKHMLDFHLEHQNVATMGVREYHYQLPYGVVRLDQGRIWGLQEKPVHTAFVNAGIYVLSPECLKTIEAETFLDMPDLFNQLIAKDKETMAFPIHEYWLDIGQIADFQKAQGDYSEVFR